MEFNNFGLNEAIWSLVILGSVGIVCGTISTTVKAYFKTETHRPKNKEER